MRDSKSSDNIFPKEFLGVHILDICQWFNFNPFGEVRDECVRDSKSSDNIFPKEFLGVHILDICQWFNFNPFGEVICADQHRLLISRCFGGKVLLYPSLIEQKAKDWTKD